MLTTYHGSCHCKAVAFEVDLDLSKGTSRCNCSYCRKIRSWGAQTTPAQFRLTKGAEQLGAYVFEQGSGSEHCFCKHCGITLFVQGDIPQIGGAFVSVMLPVLEDASPEALIAAPVTWCDGLHDNWWNPPAEIRHL
jgi:hypothetical protein